MSVCDVIAREEDDFSAGDSECGARRPCLSVCLSASPVLESGLAQSIWTPETNPDLS